MLHTKQWTTYLTWHQSLVLMNKHWRDSEYSQYWLSNSQLGNFFYTLCVTMAHVDPLQYLHTLFFVHQRLRMAFCCPLCGQCSHFWTCTASRGSSSTHLSWRYETLIWNHLVWRGYVQRPSKRACKTQHVVQSHLSSAYKYWSLYWKHCQIP